ncbi:ubiquitin carboxyl-terminal hydrolase faf-y-related [Anaeramoeba ignava]|uniref:Ubiquitin carboxyl-terminal hydrolase faf-y-related n=1 Tax=Anaeramoeba ignava TaxID=1746090 RepID=A0A9Q0LT52_ANAIG|nr:ubiquitin carboxyl-terminal hydrolase faf-y-related [Anaeramoeba ignava]
MNLNNLNTSLKEIEEKINLIIDKKLGKEEEEDFLNNFFYRIVYQIWENKTEKIEEIKEIQKFFKKCLDLIFFKIEEQNEEISKTLLLIFNFEKNCFYDYFPINYETGIKTYENGNFLSFWKQNPEKLYNKPFENIFKIEKRRIIKENIENFKFIENEELKDYPILLKENIEYFLRIRGFEKIICFLLSNLSTNLFEITEFIDRNYLDLITKISKIFSNEFLNLISSFIPFIIFKFIEFFGKLEKLDSNEGLILELLKIIERAEKENKKYLNFEIFIQKKIAINFSESKNTSLQFKSLEKLQQIISKIENEKFDKLSNNNLYGFEEIFINDFPSEKIMKIIFGEEIQKEINQISKKIILFLRSLENSNKKQIENETEKKIKNQIDILFFEIAFKFQEKQKQKEIFLNWIKNFRINYEKNGIEIDYFFKALNSNPKNELIKLTFEYWKQILKRIIENENENENEMEIENEKFFEECIDDCLNNFQKNYNYNKTNFTEIYYKEFIQKCISEMKEEKEKEKEKEKIIFRNVIELTKFIKFIEKDLKFKVKLIILEQNPKIYYLNENENEIEIEISNQENVYSLIKKIEEKIQKKETEYQIKSHPQINKSNYQKTVEEIHLYSNPIIFIECSNQIPNQYPNLKRIEKEKTPSYILIEYFELLFNLLEKEENQEKYIQKSIIELISKIPLNPKYLENISNLLKGNFTKEEIRKEFGKINSFQYLYKLKILTKIIEEIKMKIMKLENINEEFIIFLIEEIINISTINQEEIKNKKILEYQLLLLNNLNELVIDKTNQKLIVGKEKIKNFFEVIRIMIINFLNLNSNYNNQYSQKKNNEIKIKSRIIAINCLNIIRNECLSGEERKYWINQIFSIENINEIIKKTIFHCNDKEFQEIMNQIIIKIFEENIKLQKKEQSINATKLISILENPYKALFDLIKETDYIRKENYENYFNLIKELIKFRNELTKKLSTNIIIKKITEMIKEEKEENMIKNYIEMIRILIEENKKMNITNEYYSIIQEIFTNCLFNFISNPKKIQIQFYYPKLIEKENRRKAFDLIIEISKTNKNNQIQLFNLITNFQEIIQYFLSKNEKENLSKNESKKRKSEDINIENELKKLKSKNKIKSKRQYSGLTNIGATCYMNSTLQQLFMIPEFRNKIISIDIFEMKKEKEKLDSNFIAFAYFHKILRELSESNGRKSVNTRNFANNFSFWGEKLRSGEQKDASEFLNCLFDLITEQLNDRKEKDILNENFGGISMNLMDIIETGDLEEVDEEFFTISIDILGKTGLIESLDSYTSKEALKGKNQYLSLKLKRKVDTNKFVYFKKLPKYMIFQLKRFDYNYRTNRRFKVNDYFEFPKELNMEKYTREWFAFQTKKELLKMNQKKKRTKKEEERIKFFENIIEESKNQNQNQKQEYQYELVGVIVHCGSTYSGHYYSLIKENEGSKWIEFNDSTVSQFNMNYFESICFGDKKEKKSKYSNKYGCSAYILIYKAKNQEIQEIQTNTNKNNLNITKEERFYLEKENLELSKDLIENYQEILIENDEMIKKGNVKKFIEISIKFIFELIEDEYIINNYIQKLNQIFSKANANANSKEILKIIKQNLQKQKKKGIFQKEINQIISQKYLNQYIIKPTPPKKSQILKEISKTGNLNSNHFNYDTFSNDEFITDIDNSNFEENNLQEVNNSKILQQYTNQNQSNNSNQSNPFNFDTFSSNKMKSNIDIDNSNFKEYNLQEINNPKISQKYPNQNKSNYSNQSNYSNPTKKSNHFNFDTFSSNKMKSNTDIDNSNFKEYNLQEINNSKMLQKYTNQNLSNYSNYSNQSNPNQSNQSNHEFITDTDIDNSNFKENNLQEINNSKISQKYPNQNLSNYSNQSNQSNQNISNQSNQSNYSNPTKKSNHFNFDTFSNDELKSNTDIDNSNFEENNLQEVNNSKILQQYPNQNLSNYSNQSNPTKKSNHFNFDTFSSNKMKSNTDTDNSNFEEYNSKRINNPKISQKYTNQNQSNNSNQSNHFNFDTFSSNKMKSNTDTDNSNFEEYNSKRINNPKISQKYTNQNHSNYSNYSNQIIQIIQINQININLINPKKKDFWI